MIYEFCGLKITKSFFFFNFLITKSSNFISNLNDDFSQLSFEVHNVCVAQKLKILENSKQFFLAWTLATSPTSRGQNFDLSNLNRVSNFSWRYQLSDEILFVDKNENLEALDCVLQNFLPQWPDKFEWNATLWIEVVGEEGVGRERVSVYVLGQ